MAESLKTPFNMLIVGMTGSGKTHYLLDSLERDYRGHFDYVFLICPTYAHNKTYQQ
jgi:Cdc6-like AAA superfamily ATPase